MKKNLTTFILGLSFSLASLWAQTGKYTYSVNLNTVENDQLTVSLTPPKFTSKEAIFRFPKMVPGTYSIYDFGRFISDLKVEAQKGFECKVTKIDENSWKISNADKMQKITYTVDDSWDFSSRENWVFEPAGTNIEAGKNFVFNNHGIFGYFDHGVELPYEISITRPANFYASTGLNFTSTGNVDIFKTNNYHQLVDSPIMYCEPDTATFDVANANILVSVYSASKAVTADAIAESIYTLLEAQSNYLGGKLPIDKYAFIIYVPSSFTSFGFGALEHNNSSFYFLPPMGSDYLSGMVTDIAAHEFFHIITPLTIHSEEIQFFDYNEPKMSEHLWLYEGVTEYQASLVQVKYELINLEDYLEVLLSKVDAAASFDESIPFTLMSKKCLDEHKSQFANVYQKGALIGLCLDLVMIKNTKGAVNIQKLLAKLSETYGKDKAFKDEELFDVIGKLSHPAATEFLQKYVAQANPLPLEEYLLWAGIEYHPAGSKDILDFGFDVFTTGYDETNDAFYVFSQDELTDVGKAIGLKTGDVIKSVNGKVFKSNTFQQTIEDFNENLKPSDQLTFVVEREFTKGKKKTIKAVELKGRVGTKNVPSEAILVPVENPTKEQLEIREAWIGQ